MDVKTFDGETIEVPDYVPDETQEIIADTVPIIEDPTDVDRILFAVDQMLSQKKMVKEMSEEEDTEKVIDKYSKTTFKKGFDIGKRVRKEEYTEVKKALENTVEYNEISEDNLSNNKEKYSYMELGRIAYEAGLILGIFNKVYTENEKKEKENGFDSMAYS